MQQQQASNLPLNIIRICPIYYPYMSYGGSVVADYELDKAIVDEGHTITVLTCRKWGDSRDHEVVSDRHSVRYFSTLGDIKYGISPMALFQLFSFLKRHHRDVNLVWFGGVWNLLTILGPAICRAISTKYIITPHGMLISRLISLRSSTLKNFVSRHFLKSNLEKAYKVHFTVAQEFHETKLATQAEMRPIIFPLCFDLRKFDGGIKLPSIGSPSERIVLSFIGRITRKKRLDLIFEALKLLPNETKSRLIFRVVGSDSEGLWDNKLYTEAEIGIPIQYLGTLYNEALVAAFNSSDIFILCSESENFAISVVEAAYCYTALLITKEVGVSEYFSESSAVFAHLNRIDISQKIQSLVADPNRIYDYKIAARKISEQFDSSYLTDNYFQALLA